MLISMYPDDEAGAGYRARGRSRGWRGVFRRQRSSQVPGGLYAGVGLLIEAEMLEQAARLVLRGKREQAITLYRGLNGMTLQQATEAVDAQLQALQQWRAQRPWWRRWQRYPPASRKHGHRR